MSTAAPEPAAAAAAGSASASAAAPARRPKLAVAAIVLAGIVIVVHAVCLPIIFGYSAGGLTMIWMFGLAPVLGVVGVVAFVLGLVSLITAIRTHASVLLPVIALVLAVLPGVVLSVLWNYLTSSSFSFGP
ncbi:hypothetical protein N1031_00340 [Herbiconiux moechotypicola]|uniref:Uncharacterized protein n=1 Tax=Herbiconiux moechotypicola TaxID=637393 RepID=A0ABN3D9B9_9MICO|nr:hypothetical protein [Herbiconiux moechotypicola]MCS5728198.1 hypothetical protein [Herbiconiux moechotypicola]